MTVVLVTHFMEEAERLCDRVALIDAGRVVAVDTPAGLAGRAGQAQRMRFRPSEPLDEKLLRALPEVAAVVRHGGQIEVTGNGDLVQAVTSLLARRHVIAADLRVGQATLDDAFIALTGGRRKPRRGGPGAPADSFAPPASAAPCPTPTRPGPARPRPARPNPPRPDKDTR